VKQGLGSPKTWQQCGGNAVAFAQHSIMSGIGEQRGDLLQRNVYDLGDALMYEQMLIRSKRRSSSLDFSLSVF
jgi:hypothetical protein